MSEKPTYEELVQRIQALEEKVSELKEAGCKLQDSERRMREAQQLVHMGNWSWDVSSGKVEWSREVFKIFRLDPTEFTPQIDSILQLSPWPEDHVRDEELIRKAIESHEVGSYEQKFLRPDGSIGHYFSSFMGVYDGNGNLTEIKGVVQDITKRKRDEEERNKLQTQLSNALEIANLGPWEYDVAMDLFTFNDYLYKLFRTTSKEVGGYTMSSIEYSQRFFYPEDRDLVREEIRKAIETPYSNFSNQVEHRIIYADGQIGYVSVRYFAVKDESGKTVKTYGVTQDITERKRMEGSLRLTKFIFDTAPIGIWTMGKNGEILDVNEQGCSSLGYSREEICRMTVSNFDPNFDTEDWADNIATLKAVGTRSVESLHQRKNGEIFPIQVLEKMVSFEDKEIHVAFVQDITERKQAGKALRENQELLTNILESMDEAVRVYDQNYIYQLVNKKYEEMAGKSRQEVMGKMPWEVLPHLKNTLLEHSIRKAMTGEVITNIETQIKDSGETEVWVKDSFSPIKNADGNIIGVVGVGNDITRQKQDEEELRRLRNYLSNIIDSMPSILVGVDSLGRVTQWNHQAEHFTGIRSEIACSQPLDKVFPNLIYEMDRIKTAIRDRRVLRNSKVLREDREEIRFEDITIFPLVANGVGGAVIRIDDITDQVHMEEMMIQSEKMLSVGGLAAGMAHEINNPLAGMLQTAQVLSQRLKTGSNIPANIKAAESAGTTMASIEQFMEDRGIQRMIEAICESGERISKIVTNMLSFARKDDTCVSARYLDKILDKTIELAATNYDLKKEYDFKQIKIVKAYDDNLPVVSCQESKIQQVILNILTNGAQAMHGAGTPDARLIIRTYVDSVKNMACIEIEDNGPGMDEKNRKKIFDPFFTTKPEGVGTGLGLSVSYFIITENHKGEMTVESSPGAGAKFIIRLPL